MVPVNSAGLVAWAIGFGGDIMNQTLEQKAVEIIGQLQHLAPRATDIALQAARINAWSNLLAGVLWLAAFVALVVFWVKVYWPWAQASDSFDLQVANFLAGAALVIALGVSGISAINYLGDLWTYVGIFHPELALAHKLI